jgi:hypothetical protein
MRQRLRLPWMLSTETRVALGLGVVAGCLRVPLALTRPFWQDEVASARILDAGTFGGVIHGVVRTESTPPLWYVVAWLVHRAGVPVYEVRLVSVAANAALVTLVVLLASRFLPLRFAALVGALVAVGAQFSAQGRWIRAYELFALLVVAFAFVLLRAAANPTRGRLALVAATVAAGSLTHYFFLFTVAAGAAWLILEPTVRPALRRTLAAVAAGLVPFVIWSPGFVRQFQHHRYNWIGSFEWRQVVVTPLRLYTGAGSGRAALAGAVLALLACAAGCMSLWRHGAAGRLCVLLAVVPVGLAAAVWALGFRVYDVRNMIGVGPFLAVAAVTALAALPAGLRTAVPAVVLVAACASFARAQQEQGPAYDRLAHALVADGWQPGDAVAVFGNRSEFRSPLEWYLPGDPKLALTSPSRIDEPVFVIDPRKLHGGAVGIRRVNHLLVERLRPENRIRDERLLHRANVFVTERLDEHVRV